MYHFGIKPIKGGSPASERKRREINKIDEGCRLADEEEIFTDRMLKSQKYENKIKE